MEVYTGYGDKGMTDLSHTKNVSKSDDRICLMGSVEELMSHIGLVRVLVDDEDAGEDFGDFEEDHRWGF